MPRTVLLADDSVTIQRVVELTFAGQDVRVVTVGDGEQALEAIRQSVPDVVLADIDMPGRTGFEVAQFVRSQASTADVPVLLLAGAFDVVDPAKAQQAGADGILTKPFDPAVLVGRVMELLTVGRAVPSVVHVHPPSASSVFLSSRSLPTAPAESPASAGPEPASEPMASELASDLASEVASEVAAPQALAPEASEASAPVPPPAEAPVTGPDTYFDQIDQAFAALSKNPRPPAPSDQEDLPPHDDDLQPAPVPARPVTAVPLTDAFAALLEAERTGGSEPALRVAPAAPLAAAPAPSPAVSSVDLDALADQIARRVLEQLTDRVVRETVAGLVSTTAERLVREEIERIKRNIK